MDAVLPPSMMVSLKRQASLSTRMWNPHLVDTEGQPIKFQIRHSQKKGEQQLTPRYELWVPQESNISWFKYGNLLGNIFSIS